MKENKNRKYDQDRRHDEDDDQLRDNTMNETIREVRGDRDLNDRENSRTHTDDSRSASAGDTDSTQGMSYTPNDSSGVRSGGITDMDDQTAGGAGLNTGARKGSGSHLKTKDGISGSDFDGQNATS